MYRIEITADTLAELAGKAMSLAAKLNTGTAAEAPIAVKGVTSAKIDPVMPEVAEMAAVDPTPAPKSTPAAEASESQPTTPEPSSIPAPVAEPAITADVLRTLVLKVVASKGRETCKEVLSRFGLAKASDVAPEQAAELVAALEEQL